jgi:hypothetical protein
MDGAYRYYQRGRKIHILDSIIKFTKSIADSKDPFIQFTREITYEEIEASVEPCQDVYCYYTYFTRKRGKKPEGKETFYDRFEQHYDVVKHKNRNGYYYKLQQV